MHKINFKYLVFLNQLISITFCLLPKYFFFKFFVVLILFAENSFFNILDKYLLFRNIISFKGDLATGFQNKNWILTIYCFYLYY